MIRPTPTATACRSSVVVLLLPWNPIRAGSKPGARATRSSPSEQTSRLRPSSATQRATSVQRNALPA